MPMKYFKALNSDNRQEVLNFLNKWYANGSIPEHVLLAQVVLLVKKRWHGGLG